MATENFTSFVWAVLTLSAFWGWGWAIWRATHKTAADFEPLPGILALGGMCIAIFFLGALVSFDIGRHLAWVIIAYVLSGAGLVVFAVRQQKIAFPTKIHTASFIGVVLASLLLILASVSWLREFDPNDDLIAYFGFTEKILQTGSWVEIFSMRRAVTLGGQPLLQIITLLVGSEPALHIMDVGIARVIIVMLVLGACRELFRKNPLLWFLLGLVVLLFPATRINITSVNTSLVCLLGVLFVLSGKGYKTTAGLCFLTLFTAAAATFRVHIGGTAALLVMARFFSDSEWSRRGMYDASRRVLAVGAGCLFLCGPLMWMLYRDCGTPCFPPFRGNIDSTFAGMHSGDGAFLHEAQVAFLFLTGYELIALWLPACILLLLLKPRTFGIWVGAITISMTLATAFMTTTLVYGYFLRYVWPVPAALFVWSLSMAISQKRYQTHTIWFSFAVIIWLFVGGNLRELAANAGKVQESIRALNFVPEKILRKSDAISYKRLITEVPPNKKILVMVDAPYLLDYSRNDIHNVDMPGAISPRPTMPFYRGAEALRAYLQQNGITYILRVIPSEAIMFYKREYWERHPRPEKFYRKVWAPPMLDIMKNMDQLSKEYKTITDGKNQLIMLSETSSRK